MKKAILISFLFIRFLFPQELQATVTVNFEQLPSINKESLVGFQQVIADYLNNTKFTGENWQVPRINCTFNIFFLSASDEISYSAQVFIGSQRQIYKSENYSPIVTIMDNSWNFSYEKNQAMYYSPGEFNPLKSFLDYYAFLIIGMESDSWEKLGGTPFFSRAMDIVNLAFNNRSAKGWDKGSGSFNRRDLVEDLLSEKYRPMREAIYEYHYGLDFYPRNKKAGLEKIAGFVKTMSTLRSKIDARSVFVKTFFDAKHGELIDYLIQHPEKVELFKILKAIDPPHAGKFDEAMNK